MSTNSLVRNKPALLPVLDGAIKRLQQADIATARLDALVLLEDLTGKDRSWLLANPNHELNARHRNKFEQQIQRRATHEPLAYIRGKTEFYGREFAVSPHTLEPRPETETMIDLFKKSVPINEHIKLADIGTGSGAIGITIALEAKIKDIDLIDIDPQALKIAAQNCQKYQLDLRCLEANLLNGNETVYDILVANLPYVPDSHTINQAAMQEPKHAIFGGSDGLDLYRQLFKQADRKPRYIFTESLPFQHAQLAKIALENGYQQTAVDDFIQLFTVSRRPS